MDHVDVELGFKLELGARDFPEELAVPVRRSVFGVGVGVREPVLDPNQPVRAHNLLQRGLHVVKVAKDQSQLLHVNKQTCR